MGAPAVPTLVDALAGPERTFDDGTSWHSKAFRVLSLMGQRAVDPLMELSLNSSAKAVRQVARDCLDKLKVPLQVSAAQSGDETAVASLIDEMRHAVGWSTRLRLAQQLASTGHPSAVVPLQQVLEHLQHLMSLDHIFYNRVRAGRVDPSLRDEIKRFDRILQCDMNLSPNATISREDDDWVLHDRDRRYLLREGEEVRLQTGLMDEWVTAGHKLDIELPHDDERLRAIRRVARPTEALPAPNATPAHSFDTHQDRGDGYCGRCFQPWPCPPSKSG